MQIEKLVTLINLELKKDSNISVNKICNKLQLKQSTVKTQLRNNGYSYNAQQRQYTKDIDIDKLNELINLIEPIKEIIEQHNKSKTIIEVHPIELKAKAVTEVKQKLFKVDVEVLKKWDKFVVDHKEFKVQQLISLALEEFINKYS